MNTEEIKKEVDRCRAEWANRVRDSEWSQTAFGKAWAEKHDLYCLNCKVSLERLKKAEEFFNLEKRGMRFVGRRGIWAYFRK